MTERTVTIPPPGDIADGLDDDELEPAADRPEPGSIFDTLAQLRDNAVNRGPLYLDVPGYGGQLWACYRQITEDERARSQRFAARPERRNDPDTELILATDQILWCCLGLYMKVGQRGPDGQGLQPLAEFVRDNDGDVGEGPVYYDRNAAAAFRVPVDTDKPGYTREVVWGLFPTPQAVIAHHLQIATWWTATVEEDADPLATSPATQP